MKGQLSTQEIGQRIRAVATAQTQDFRHLIEIGGLDPVRDLRFHDWTGVSFADQDLRGIDFSGARFVHCDFNNALIEGARFDKAVLDTTDRFRRTDLSKAKDWRAYKRTWRRAAQPIADGHLRPGLVFQDAPMAPRMVPILPGKVVRQNPRSRLARLARKVSNAKGATTHIIRQPIAVSELRVTEGEYQDSASGVRRVMRDLGDLFFSKYESKVTARVEELQVEEYLAWLRGITGMPYRLLTLGEWLYCCSERGECEGLGLIPDDNEGDWCDGDRVVWSAHYERYWFLSNLPGGFRVARDLLT